MGTLEQLEPGGRELNEACRHFAENNPDAPPVVRNAPGLVAEASRLALLWARDLLVATDAAARARPAALPGFERLMSSVDDYFAEPTRWPQVRALTRPLLMLVPAYYAVRGVQLLNFHVQPPLLAVAYDDAHEFMEEVLGGPAAMTVRQHKNVDLAGLPKVSADADGPVPRQFRHVFAARLLARLDGARRTAYEADARREQTSPEPPAPPASADEHAAAVRAEANAILAGLWRRRLTGTRILLRSENHFEPGYAGGSSYHSSETALALHEGGRYLLLETTVSRVSSGGLQIGGEPQVSESSGAWTVEVAGEHEYLRLDGDTGSTSFFRIGGSSGGTINLDGEDRGWSVL